MLAFHQNPPPFTPRTRQSPAIVFPQQKHGCMSPVTQLPVPGEASGVWPQQLRCLSPATSSKQGWCLPPMTQMSVPQQLVPWKTRVPVPQQPSVCPQKLRCVFPAKCTQVPVPQQPGVCPVCPQQLVCPQKLRGDAGVCPPATCPLENAGVCPRATRYVSPATRATRCVSPETSQMVLRTYQRS